MSVKQRKPGMTRGKLALIAVLAVVQMVVLVRAVGNMSSTPEQLKVNVATNPPLLAATSASSAPIAAQTTDRRPWPELSLDDALACDPFARPLWLATVVPTVATADQPPSLELEQLKQQGASIVIVTNGGKAATIGTQHFRVGDVIDGYQVTDITVRGVEFTRVTSP